MAKGRGDAAGGAGLKLDYRVFRIKILTKFTQNERQFKFKFLILIVTSRIF